MFLMWKLSYFYQLNSFCVCFCELLHFLTFPPLFPILLRAELEKHGYKMETS